MPEDIEAHCTCSSGQCIHPSVLPHPYSDLGMQSSACPAASSREEEMEFQKKAQHFESTER